MQQANPWAQYGEQVERAYETLYDLDPDHLSLVIAFVSPLTTLAFLLLLEHIKTISVLGMSHSLFPLACTLLASLSWDLSLNALAPQRYLPGPDNLKHFPRYSLQFFVEPFHHPKRFAVWLYISLSFVFLC